MAKIKKKLTAEQKRSRKAEKAERQQKYEWVFMNGKQVRVKRRPIIDGKKNKCLSHSFTIVLQKPNRTTLSFLRFLCRDVAFNV